MRRLLPFLGLALFAVGCSGGEGDSGDVATATKASAGAPKSASDLPANLPPQKRAEAVAGIGAQQAMAAQMEKQAAGMKATRGGGP